MDLSYHPSSPLSTSSLVSLAENDVRHCDKAALPDDQVVVAVCNDEVPSPAVCGAGKLYAVVSRLQQVSRVVCEPTEMIDGKSTITRR